MLILNWVNSNSGAILAVSTIVYTILTLLLVHQNRNAINETKNQFNATQKQFFEMNRGRVFPSLVHVADLNGTVLCLKFENPSNTPIEHMKFSINHDWLSQYDSIETDGEGINKSTKANLEAINSADFFTLMPKQSIFYTICSIPGKAYGKLCDKLLEVSIIYPSPENSIEKFTFHLKSMGTQLATSSDYVRLEREHIHKLEEIIKTLNKSFPKSFPICRI